MSDGGAVRAHRFDQHVATSLRDQAQIQKQGRLAREEAEQERKRKGKKDGE
jgi:hypothetical protein